MTAAELKTLRRNTDSQIEDLFAAIEKLMGEVSDLEGENETLTKERDEALARVEELEAEARGR